MKIYVQTVILPTQESKIGLIEGITCIDAQSG